GGEPFFWLGDTGWEMFRRLDLEDARFYLETRARQGFNVIQAMFISEFESHKEDTGNVHGEHSLTDWNPERPNPAFLTTWTKSSTSPRKSGCTSARFRSGATRWACRSTVPAPPFSTHRVPAFMARGSGNGIRAATT
ncbi:MAG: hypothetical protein C4332_14965, partial [Meiothermus sp.]